MNKIACTQWGFPGNGWYAVRMAAAAGLDGLQIELGSYEKGYSMAQKVVRDAYLEEGAKFGIEFPSLVLNDLTVNEFVNGRDTERGKISYEQMKLGIDVAADMGIKVVMIPNFFNNFITEEKHYANAADALKFCCDEAGQHGITIATEGVLAWKDHKRIVDAVNMPNLEVFFDSMNYKFFSGLNQLEVLNDVYPSVERLGQLHVKDGTDVLSGGLLGEGDMDFFAQIEELKKRKYKGWIIIEDYYCEGPNKDKNILDQLSLLKKDIATLKSALAD